MSTGLWSAVSGALGQQTALDATANNLANARTSGYRADRVVFREYLSAAQAADPSQRPAIVSSATADMTPGAIEQTDRPLDVAIDGEGFFAVQTPAGERYTRAGSIQMSSDGELTVGGNRLLDESHSPLTLPAGTRDVRVSSNGTVLANGQELGRVLVVRFDPNTALEKDGAVLLRAPAGVAGTPSEPKLLEGCLEGSNVSVVKGMTELVSQNRGFDALSRAIETFGEMERKAAMGIMSPR